jgi:hypothetical protein
MSIKSQVRQDGGDEEEDALTTTMASRSNATRERIRVLFVAAIMMALLMIDSRYEEILQSTQHSSWKNLLFGNFGLPRTPFYQEKLSKLPTL